MPRRVLNSHCRRDFLSLSALSRALDLSWPRAHRLLVAGVLIPDHQTLSGYLFKPERLPEIKAAVEAAERTEAERITTRKQLITQPQQS